MSQSSELICVITPGHVASAPRVVKEADALVAAGYRVHVVCGRSYPPLDPFDDEIFSAASWGRTPVDFVGLGGAFRRKILQRGARILLARWPNLSLRLAARAHHAEAIRLAHAASRIPASLYIGHCLAGLPAAAFAAQATGAHYSFDVEDLHDEETHASATHPADRVATRRLQTQLLPGCAHVTASSPLITAELQRRYGVDATTVLNVFPLAHGPQQPATPAPIGPNRPAVFYWFSQTIGPGRGLEQVIAILAHMRTPRELHLRGFPAPGYREHLHAIATRSGLPPVTFLAPGAPSEMVRLAASADIGLACEESQPLNRDLCLTNKIFVYLLAGLPQLLSPTTAQTALAGELGEAALLSEPDKPAETARRLDDLLTDPARIARACAAAWRLARERLNWDREQMKLLHSVKHALTPPSRVETSRHAG